MLQRRGKGDEERMHGAELTQTMRGEDIAAMVARAKSESRVDWLNRILISVAI